MGTLYFRVAEFWEPGKVDEDLRRVYDICAGCFRKPVGKVAYHVPCHLRAQNPGTQSADVLRAIPGAEVEVIERCSAVDGTWGLKKQYYELSLAVAKPLFDAVRATGAPTVATDCPLAALQIAQGTGAAPRAPVQILADAYGIDDTP